ncbi:hypothetical protein D5S18_07460 [Nocardia panacis]|uniref:Uncharacterized protein n=1 Tax=Nocardia panacis TaxID=2340916 RepID=A0A3A4KPU3_9NOCA|nr:hypothetical protein D5S18_07460 [Nocardia panacis]
MHPNQGLSRPRNRHRHTSQLEILIPQRPFRSSPQYPLPVHRINHRAILGCRTSSLDPFTSRCLVRPAVWGGPAFRAGTFDPRMVEARAKGASTTEAVRVGTAHTGRIITAAAPTLPVPTVLRRAEQRSARDG